MESNWGGVCHTGEMVIQYLANSLVLLPWCFHHTPPVPIEGGNSVSVSISKNFRSALKLTCFLLGGKHFQKNRFLKHDTGPTHHQTCLCVFFLCFLWFLVVKNPKTPRTWEFLKFPSECFVKFIGRRDDWVWMEGWPIVPPWNLT